MRLLDFYPAKGSFLLRETVTFLIELENPLLQEATLRLAIQHLADPAIIFDKTLRLSPGQHRLEIYWNPPATPAGYSARLEVFPGNHLATTAFDVLASWMDFPRYGFLSDFRADRPDPDATLRSLARFHINGLQFYDWQYRHDQLLAPREEYVDPLGRAMSLHSVRQLVETAHRYGMAALPYLAIYAASAAFWREHADWVLYDQNGNPIPFGENFLGLMDPSAGRAWSRHLLAEAARTLQAIPFDGLHIDQYGEPKKVWDSNGNPVDLPRAFADFVHFAAEQHPGRTILFNAVGNWPIEALAGSAVDFLYIEVWPPEVEYRQLAEIVLNAVRLSHGKAVVIALYLPADRPANNLLADAVILACGATRIELGENTRLLANPYFPKHEEIPAELALQLRQLSDFAVRNGEWLRPYTLSLAESEVWSQADLNLPFISAHDTDTLWSVARKHAQQWVIQLVNLQGLPPRPRWDEAHPAPTSCENVPLEVQLSARPRQIFWDAPEQAGGAQPLDFEYTDGVVRVRIPQLHFTALVSIYE